MGAATSAPQTTYLWSCHWPAVVPRWLTLKKSVRQPCYQAGHPVRQAGSEPAVAGSMGAATSAPQTTYLWSCHWPAVMPRWLTVKKSVRQPHLLLNSGRQRPQWPAAILSASFQAGRSAQESRSGVYRSGLSVDIEETVTGSICGSLVPGWSLRPGCPFRLVPFPVLASLRVNYKYKGQ